MRFFQKADVEIRNGRAKKMYRGITFLDTGSCIVICSDPEGLIEKHLKRNEDFVKKYRFRRVKDCLEYVQGVLESYAEDEAEIKDLYLKRFLKSHTRIYGEEVKYTIYNTDRIACFVF